MTMDEINEGIKEALRTASTPEEAGMVCVTNGVALGLMMAHSEAECRAADAADMITRAALRDFGDWFVNRLLDYSPEASDFARRFAEKMRSE